MINIRRNISKPAHDVFEITTIGTGSSKGESVVVHLGNDEWIIIDCCRSAQYDMPLPLHYLHEIGVTDDMVKMIICTHWHGDHIDGLSTLIEKCTNADFYIAAIGEYKDFVQFILSQNASTTTPYEAWIEMKACLDALSARTKSRKAKFLFHDQVFFQNKDRDVTVYSLSPSDDMIVRFDSLLARLKLSTPNKDDVDDLDANMCSLALAIDYKGQKIFIGGDIETGLSKISTPRDCTKECDKYCGLGMCNIVHEGIVYNQYKPFNYVQIAHHGSVTAYCPIMWNDHIAKEDAIGTTTLYLGRGESLPRREMLKIFQSKIKKLYITGVSAAKKNDKLDVKIKAIDNISDLPNYVDDIGIIVSRYNPSNLKWKHTQIGAAKRVTKKFLSQYHTKYVR